jgi:uncharacterized protein (TIGR02448 family)
MLKNLGMTLVLVIALTGSAFASGGPCGDNDDSDGPSGMCVLLLSTGPLGTSIAMSAAMSDNDGREAYVGQVRDDAAEYVGAGGSIAPSALLKNAMDSLREKTSKTVGMTDLEIAKALISSKTN